MKPEALAIGLFGARGKSLVLFFNFPLIPGSRKVCLPWGFPVTIVYTFIIFPVHDAYPVHLLLFYGADDLWKIKLLITKLITVRFSPSTSYFQIQALPTAVAPSGTSSVRVLRLKQGPVFYACADKHFILLCYMLIQIILNRM
jgi:hypothetical protein